MTQGERLVALLSDDVSLDIASGTVVGTLDLFDPERPEPTSTYHTVRLAWHEHDVDLSAERILAEVARLQPHALSIGPDVPEKLALEVAALIDQEQPTVGTILVRKQRGDLWREAARCGVRDIISPEAIAADYMPAVQAACERAEGMRQRFVAASASIGQESKVIVVLSPKGGSGKTMVSTNLASALATTFTGDAVIVDLDCMFGDVASVLGMVPDHTIGELAMLPSFDSTTLKVYLSRHEQSGLYVLAGPAKPEEADAVTPAVVGHVIDLLRRDFQYVIVDTAAGLDEHAQAAIEHATDLLLLASMDIASIRNLKKEVDVLDRLGSTSARRHFVLNRADARVGLEMPDVEAAIGLRITESLASSRSVPVTMNQGRALVLEEPDSPLAHQLKDLARVFAPHAAPLPVAASSNVQKKQSLFGRKKH